MKMRIKKVLIANRGEIAIRIMKTLRELGVTSVALYTEPEKDDLHIKMADESFLLQGETLNDQWLNVDQIIDIAKRAQADAIHPGYGFLSENYLFAKACEESGIIFIGPHSKVIEKMGSKTLSAQIAAKANIPLLPRIEGSPAEIIEKGNFITYPALVKAAAGGGGKGMIKVENTALLKHAVYTAAEQAKRYFADEKIFLEKYIENPRHIEVQVLADRYGNAVHLFERECTLQRNHQKVVEEAPSVSLSGNVKQKLYEAALRLVKETMYYSAGTVEFIIDQDQNFYFLEMNTRIQVEHPVTEMITGVDLIAEQIRIAQGKQLSFSQKDIRIRGHAIETRLYAEDPAHHFRPSAGKIHKILFAREEGIRIDSAILTSGKVHASFDAMIAKIIASGSDRTQAVDRLKKTLNKILVHGVTTNIQLLKNLLQQPDFADNRIHTNYIAKNLRKLSQSNADKNLFSYFAALFIWLKRYSIYEKSNAWRMAGTEYLTINGIKTEYFFHLMGENNIRVKIHGKTYLLENISLTDEFIHFRSNNKDYSIVTNVTFNSIMFLYMGSYYLVEKTEIEPLPKTLGKGKDLRVSELRSSLFGRVLKINVSENQKVENGQILMVLESMKMENSILAPASSKVARINVKVGQQVADGQTLIKFSYDD
ncbi:MAG: acetyl/propionyl/methylcrotonyl-CoA carboxylase subunit alpha [Bacteroidota bacterium]